jgi:hypothetical protein
VVGIVLPLVRLVQTPYIGRLTTGDFMMFWTALFLGGIALWVMANWDSISYLMGWD